MSSVNITVDPSISEIGVRLRQAAQVGLFRLAELTEQTLREEVPVVTTNLRQGISSEVDADVLQAFVNVSARSGRRGARSAQLVKSDGKTIPITLRAQAAFDYAEAVARGTGVFGPTGQRIKPKNAKVLLVPGAPKTGKNGKSEAYVLGANGQTFVFRRSIKGRPANPFDERALRRVEPQIAGVFDDALRIVLEEDLP